ncbi:hypothetical protein ACIPUP_02740 [Pectobacterium actinidiae]|uniref:Uncharacterized protein n=1 Tax=Pectobacterium actinidiae TaxID=1507808 RepID=A0ABW8G696_9GAMM
MPIADAFWYVLPLMIIVPLALVAGGRLLYRKRGKIGPGMGSAIFIISCWIFALGIVLHRIGVIQWSP